VPLQPLKSCVVRKCHDFPTFQKWNYMGLKGAVFLCFSGIPRSIPKLPDAKNDDHPWELGYAIHTDHRKWFQKCRPEQTKKLPTCHCALQLNSNTKNKLDVT